MSNSVLSIQPVNPATQTQQTTPTPKNQQTATQTATPQDKVTISPQAQQALAKTTKAASSGDVDHDGDSH